MVLRSLLYWLFPLLQDNELGAVSRALVRGGSVFRIKIHMAHLRPPQECECVKNPLAFSLLIQQSSCRACVPNVCGWP